MESITPRRRINCLSFILGHPPNNIGKCMVVNTHRYRLPRTRLRRCSHQNNSQCCCIVGNTNTSALTPPCCATLLDISVGFVYFRLDKCPPLLAVSATDRLHWCILRSGMPGDATVARRIVFTWSYITRATDGSATIAQESIDDRHHSDPQHTAHFPLLCRGLHLSLVSP